MTESHAELSQLKQEVAELWSRYRKDAPLVADDEARHALALRNRNLEAKRKMLSERSATLRAELEQLRRRASRLSPVVRVLGGVMGAVLAGVMLSTILQDVADASVGLTIAQGAGLLTASLLLVALSVSRAHD
jgi:hypothetical protein